MIARILLALTVIFLAIPAHAQVGGGVTSSGPITPNDCVSWLAPNVIQDSGAGCGGGGGGVSSFTGDGALITNSASTGAVTATLGTTANLTLNSLVVTTTESVTGLTATTVTGTTGNFPTLNFTNALGTTITATTFNGALSGNATTATTATNATNVALTLSTSNVNYDLIGTTTGTGNVPVYGTSTVTFNPSTSILTGVNESLSGTLTGVTEILSGTLTVAGKVALNATTTGSLIVNSGSTGADEVVITSSNVATTAFVVANTSTNGHTYQIAATGQTNLPGRFYYFDETAGAFVFSATTTNASLPAASVSGWIANIAGGLTPDTGLSRDSAGVIDVGTGAAASKAGTLNALVLNQNGSKVIDTAGTGLIKSGSTLSFATTGTSGVPLTGSGGTPTCGTGCASINAGSTDERGSMVSGSSVSSVALSFSTTLGFTPTCVISDSNTTATADISAISTSSLTVNLASALSAITIYWICVQ